ncbi:Vegetative incompatibility protein HET-E-1 [Psilocybe cubensis]|uniref:Vegetative incompatibility protein HET-E-1 n=1 Tax=Psilocybe cubensis TaxID=181762 RepID=A0ACB8GNL5_PSICU|nr:Vegetative incompatibility protein HET-E-1 [Psilocybe cubensis]KAH9477151.1 Vegetative incompatibility protein HET-E-1 [Psilocybe cubensis]
MNKVPLAQVHVAQFEEQIEQLLDNDSKSFPLKDRKGETVAQIDISLFLCETPDDFISDFMEKVDHDVSNLKSIEGGSKRVFSVLGPVLQSMKALMDNFADAHPLLKTAWKVVSSVYDAMQETEIKGQEIQELAENLREMLATANEKLDLPKVPHAVDIIKEIGQYSLQVASIIHEYTKLSFAGRAVNLQGVSMQKRIDECQRRRVALNKRLYGHVKEEEIMEEVKKEVFKVKNEILAGSGKTILMCSVLDQLPEPNSSTAVGRFLFDARDGQTETQLHMKFIRSLACQLCDSRHGGIPQEMVDLRNKCGAFQPLDDQLEETVLRILAGFDRVFIAIDALDECMDRQRTLDWVQKLLTKADTPTHVHLIVTSRREPDITDVFDNLNGDRIDVVNPANQDIGQYISEHMKSPKLPQIDEETRTEVEYKLRNRANGSPRFRYIALMLAELQQCASLDDLKKALSQLPNGLDEIYARVLSKCKEENSFDLRIFLQFLAFSVSDIEVDELAETITIETSSDGSTTFNAEKRYLNLSDVLELCGGLVVVTSDFRNRSEFCFPQKKISYRLMQNIIRHHQVVSFFGEGVSYVQSSSRQVRLAEAASHIEISKTLLSYLLEIHATTNKSVFPLKNYAVKTWTEYVRYQGVDGDVAVFEITARLLRLGIPALVNSHIYGLDLFDPTEMVQRIPPRPLHWASLLGLVGVVKYLLGDVNNLNPKKDTDHQKGISSSRNSVDVSEVCLKHFIDVNAIGGKYGTALQAASYRGHKSIVELLLQHGADVNAMGGKYGTALQVASYKGHDFIVEALIEHGADVNAMDGQYGTALQAASYMGHESIVEALLQHGADVNAIGGQHDTALQAASFVGDDFIVKTLLQNGADVNAIGGKYGTALQVASYCGHKTIVKTLLQNGADVNAMDGQYGTALQVASYRGYYSIVEALLQHSTDVNVMGGQYGTALQAASYCGHKSIVELLLQHGADVNAMGGKYGTALQMASYKGHDSIVEALLEHGADVNVMDGQYGTALQAASYGGHESIVEALLKHGADVNATGGQYGTALHVASCRAWYPIVEALLQHGADVNAIGGQYGTVLQAASYEGDDLIITALLQHGADVNAMDGQYGTPLQVVSDRGHCSTAVILLQHGADVNVIGGQCGTALQAASYEGNEFIVALLLQHGADVNALGGQYGTALQAASYGGDTSVVRDLLNEGANINAIAGKYGTALVAASCTGNEYTVYFLLLCGANVNAVGGEYGGTALHAASYHGYYSIVDLLLHHKADVNASDGDHNDALQAACSRGHDDIVELLLNHNAKVASLDYLDCLTKPTVQEKLRIAYVAQEENVH